MSTLICINVNTKHLELKLTIMIKIRISKRHKPKADKTIRHITNLPNGMKK